MLPKTSAAATQDQIAHALAPDGRVRAALLQAFPQAIAIYAFGSRVLGNAQPDSDLDLAILVEAYAPPLQLWDAASALAAQYGCPVDLLDLRAASTVMQYQVLTTGQCLWAKPLEAGLFACFVMSEKLALDAARAPLLSDIAKRGQIYAR